MILCDPDKFIMRGHGFLESGMTLMSNILSNNKYTIYKGIFTLKDHQLANLLLVKNQQQQQ